jgi:prepilin-type N-terminal cleavage/methylation domain-containing protein
MTKSHHRRARNPEGGFTLIELLVVVLIIGILAAIAIPQYFKVVEKGKAAEALTTLDSIRGAEERYLANTGNYCTAAFTTCTGWDLQIPSLKYFTVGTAQAGSVSPSWKLQMTRIGNPALYGSYIVTYDVEPGAQPAITCSQSNCSSDLMPQ